MLGTEAILEILDNPAGHPWTVQGLGMLRLYLDPARDWRLNIWHSSLANVGVSRMHNHPWAFESHIVCGQIENTRFREVPAGTGDIQMQHSRLHCSNVGELEGPVTIRDLRSYPSEKYGPGECYRQAADEIHLSNALDGTVTLLRRHRQGGNEHAAVFWPIGQPFGDARKSPPTSPEILMACAIAASRLRPDAPA